MSGRRWRTEFDSAPLSEPLAEELRRPRTFAPPGSQDESDRLLAESGPPAADDEDAPVGRDVARKEVSPDG